MTPNKLAATFVRIALNIAVLVAVAAGAAEWGGRVPLLLHGAVLTGGSVVGTILLAFGTQVFGRMDKLLTDFEDQPFSRTERIYSYVTSARARLVVWVSGAIPALATCAGVAYLVKETGPATPGTTLSVGYGSLAFVLLAVLRIVTAYLSLDRFRLDLVRIKREESARVELIGQEQRRSVLAKFPSEPQGRAAGG